MKLLAIETSTEACSVAVYADGAVLARHELAPRRHTQLVLPWAEELLAEAGLAKSQLDAIAVGRGPGAFTGVRIAIGVVQGLAFALERPVLPVSNLAALAQGALREQGAQHVAAAIDARMDEVYWGCYQASAGEMRLVGQEAVLPPERVALPDASTAEWFGAGTGWGYAERLAVKVAASNPGALPNALDILSLATFAWARDEAIVAEQAQPVYLRDNVATPKAR